MNEQEFLMEVLLENINIKCQYYIGDEEICEKYGLLENGASFPTCNCDGEIKKCDLYRWAKLENLLNRRSYENNSNTN